MFAELGKFGSKIEQHKPKEFSQTAFKTKVEKLESKDSNIEAPKGYCAGVTLEWIRRVLLGGRKTEGNSSYLTFGYDEIKQQLDKTPKSTKAYNKLQLMLLAWREQDASQNRSKLAHSTPHSVKHKKKDWENVTWISDFKAEDLRGKPRTRPLSNLDFQDGTEHRNVDWSGIDKLLKEDEFVKKAGNAVRLGFGKRVNGHDSGHSVAIWRRRKAPDMHDAYYFFDPNFGLFAYDIEGLGKAMTALFGWPVNGDTPRYRCTAQTGETFTRADFGIEVFGPANCVDPLPETIDFDFSELML